MTAPKPLGITDVVLRDTHQSLFATRLRLDDMLPIAAKLDQIGYWSLESWGGATFDACIRYLGEDPWERVRELKAVMPNTPQQMLFRGQNILGYRHYADDVVEKFVERAAINGIDVFRVFDAMNDMRNLETAVKAVIKQDKHAQGTISYTVSPVHSLEGWIDMGRQIEDLGAHSICIKDMAGLLKPYTGYELIKQLKQAVDIPIHMHCHATTGLSSATYLKCIEAGVDNIDTAISSMSMTYGHSSTESLVAMLEGTDRDSGLNLSALEDIALYFREVRKKYAKFEGSLKGIDARILTAQVPGGMLTNMENQLREQGASDRFDDVLEEIPKVRKDLGYIPLVTPTSQIVGTQSVMNILMGERYKSIARETAGVLKGEYGATPAPVNEDLQARVLGGKSPITCRPADLIEPELDKLTSEFNDLVAKEKLRLSQDVIDDVLTYTLFPQVGLKFLQNRDNPDAFEPVPTATQLPAAVSQAKTNKATEVYTVNVEGKAYVVEVSEGGDIQSIQNTATPQAGDNAAPPQGDATITAPLAGNIIKVNVSPGEHIQQGDVVIILEAMKMETEVRTTQAGEVVQVMTKPGDNVAVGDILLSLN